MLELLKAINQNDYIAVLSEQDSILGTGAAARGVSAPSARDTAIGHVELGFCTKLKS